MIRHRPSYQGRTMGNYAKAPGITGSPRCHWPACDLHAFTEIKRGPMPFVQLCRSHRPLWDLLSDEALHGMVWEPKRRLGSHA